MTAEQEFSVMPITRRQFLATASVPLFLPGLAMGANDRVNIGFIGCGRRANQLKMPDSATVVAACDVIRLRAERFAKDYQAKAYKDYRDILDCRDVDAVVIATPDHWHAPPTIHACQAGKDVFVEKPVGLTVNEGKKMVQAARKYKRVVQVGTQARSLHNNQLGCEIVRAGLLGKPQRAICYLFDSGMDKVESPQAVPEGLDWDMYLGQARRLAYNQNYLGWGAYTWFSGGEIVSTGVHSYDYIQWALGIDGAGPTEVEAMPGYFAKQYEPERDIATPEHYSSGALKVIGPREVAPGEHGYVRWTYPNGMILEFGHVPKHGVRIYCEKGNILIDRDRLVIRPKSLEQEIMKDREDRRTHEVAHMANFIDCVKTRQRPNADIEIVQASTNVGHLGNIARIVGGRLRWNPETQTFVGNERANALLDRERRKKYDLPAI